MVKPNTSEEKWRAASWYSTWTEVRTISMVGSHLWL
jgi:hypothetical protein